MNARPTKHRRVLAAGLLVAAGVAGATALAIGSDHQDTPDVELNPKMDMTDVYVFPSPTPGRIVLVMNTPRVSHPGAGGRSGARVLRPRPALPVQDRQRRRRHRGPGHPGDLHRRRRRPSRSQVRGPIGAARRRRDDERGRRRHAGRVGRASTPSLGTAADIQVFAGPRDDPFFLDLEAVFCILPDRKPVDRRAVRRRATSRQSGAVPLPPPGVNYVERVQRAVHRGRASERAARERRSGPARHLGHHQPLKAGNTDHAAPYSHAAGRAGRRPRSPGTALQRRRQRQRRRRAQPAAPVQPGPAARQSAGERGAARQAEPPDPRHHRTRPTTPRSSRRRSSAS